MLERIGWLLELEEFALMKSWVDGGSSLEMFIEEFIFSDKNDDVGIYICEN